ncbi:spike base protein, RCAP_Rcc01079 family [Parasedimentitalea huanghaiensis]|uniref:Uncharacterized protein n=1 Tax=Parasedimentitalea huanghaiensis TaxID=2682100 RepID=A0A6L6WMJ7_9RHOB|nr:hypothetical protein [Zongyanglinia huanghaiensis]MVO16862.1 hypothetical protein [Zongyanglinia huanghaiensis]
MPPVTDHYIRTQNASAPPSGCDSVVPNDAADLPRPIRGLMVTGAGDVKCEFIDGSIDTLPGLLPGFPYGGLIKKIFADGTTATGIKGLT